MNLYKAEWLAQIETQRANKFYRKFHFRGKVKSSDLCAVVKNKSKDIIASGFLRAYSSFHLLTGIAVAPHLQRKGIGKRLIQLLSTRFTRNTYTFPYAYLTSYYQELGFQLLESEPYAPEVENLFARYINQGRDIQIMVYSKSSH